MCALTREYILKLALGAGASASPIMPRIAERTHRMLSLVESELGKAPYLVGAEFSAADLMMELCFTSLERFAKQPVDGHPNITAWLKRLRARPAYRRTLAAGGPKPQPAAS